MNGKTTKCPLCGRLYIVYSNLAEDQTVCPVCRKEAQRTMDLDRRKPSQWTG